MTTKKKTEWIGVTKVAQALGVTRDAVRQARISGRLKEGTAWKKQGKTYKFDLDRTRYEWNANSQRPQTTAVRPSVKGKLDNLTLNDIKKQQAAVDLDRKTLELETLKGTLVAKDEVYTELFEFAQKVRRRLQAVPSRIVDELLAARTRPEALKMLTEAIDEALTELSDNKTYKL